MLNFYFFLYVFVLEGVEKENRFLCSGEGRIEEEAEMREGVGRKEEKGQHFIC